MERGAGKDSSLAAIIESARQRLQSLDDRGRPGGDAVLYTGDWRDMIPRAIVRNSAVDVYSFRVYSILLSYASPDSPGVFPRIDTLTSCTGLSRPTIIDALCKLRLQGWITAVPRVRNGRGQYIGSIYLVHAKPVEFSINLKLDPDYISLLLRSSIHRNKAVRCVANTILSSLREDTENGIDIGVPLSAIEQFASQIAANKEMSALPESSPVQNDMSNLTNQLVIDELGYFPRGNSVKSHVNTLMDAPAKTESDRAWLLGLMKPNQVNKVDLVGESTVLNDPSKPRLPGSLIKNEKEQQHTSYGNSSYNQVLKTTTTTTPLSPIDGSSCSELLNNKKNNVLTASNGLIWPSTLHFDERKLIEPNLEKLPLDQQQDVLDEFSGLSAAGSVKNPVMYLRALCVRAQQGNFSITSAGLKVKRARMRQLRIQQQIQQIPETSEPEVRHEADASPLLKKVRALQLRAEGGRKQ